MAIALVAGALANKPWNGGAAWTRLSWALGLRRLGFDVCFVEQIDHASCPADAVAYFGQVTDEFGLAGSAALVDEAGDTIYGLDREHLRERAEAAEALVNITGHLTLGELKRPARRKIYVDLDPGFTQYWHAAGVSGPHLAGHDFYFTVGENIGARGCPIPTSGIRWQPTRQPVVLEHWPVSDGGERDRFTTVGSWRGPYGPVAHEGRTFGLKVHEFRKFLELPLRVEQTFEAALEIHPSDRNDRDLLERHGWKLADPTVVASDPAAFRSYVQGSGAEFSVAQGIYVETKSGWFSDRSVRYLASGKPAVVQETGFSRHLPVGQGLLAFTTLEEAVRAARAVDREYDRHAQAARALAEAYFDSDKVLGRLLEEVGMAP